jgi:hypothetical protein
MATSSQRTFYTDWKTNYKNIQVMIYTFQYSVSLMHLSLINLMHTCISIKMEHVPMPHERLCRQLQYKYPPPHRAMMHRGTLDIRLYHHPKQLKSQHKTSLRNTTILSLSKVAHINGIQYATSMQIGQEVQTTRIWYVMLSQLYKINTC